MSVFQETSDGSPIGWTGFWDEPDGVRMVVQVYDLDRSVLETLVPTIKRADPKTAQRIIAASDPAYQYQRGPASAVRQIATGQSGSSTLDLPQHIRPRPFDYKPFGPTPRDWPPSTWLPRRPGGLPYHCCEVSRS